MESPYSSTRRSTPPTAGLLLGLVVAVATFAVSFDGGAYALTSRNAIAIGLLWILGLAVALGLIPRRRPPAAVWVAGGSLTLLAAWTGLSTLWATSEEKSFAEFDRVVLFLALFWLVALSAGTTLALRGWLRGLAAGIAAVGILALSSRLFPGTFADTTAVEVAQLFPSLGNRLGYPLDYWNGLATLLALGLPCLLWAAAAERRAVVRGLALLPVPALAAALYLTSSRGGIAVAVLGSLVFVVLARSWRALGAVVVGAAGAAFAALVLLGRDALAAGPLEPGAAAEGRSAALLIVLICVGVAVAHTALSSLRLDPGRAQAPLGWGLAALTLVAVAATLLATDPIDRFEEFKAVPTGAENKTITSHLASGSGNGRWQLWSAAAEQFSEHPVKGEGAGSYEAWWAENATLGLFVRDAHSLYLETLAELGVVGFLLLGATLVTGLAVGLRRAVLADLERRLALAALLGTLVAWLVEAGIDWIWESTVVTLVAIACLALLVGPATATGGAPLRRTRVSLAARIAVPLVLLGLVVAQGIPLLAQSEIERSRAAVRDGDAAEALDAAAAAQRLQPWAASPHVQRALVEELRGDLPAAQEAIGRAVELDERDWRYWLVDARIETKLENFDAAEVSLRRAIALNPKSSRFSGLDVPR